MGLKVGGSAWGLARAKSRGLIYWNTQEENSASQVHKGEVKARKSSIHTGPQCSAEGLPSE